MRFLKEGREWRLPGILYAVDLVVSGNLEEDLKVMVGCFVEVCGGRGLKVNANKSKVMMLGAGGCLECEIHVDGAHWCQMSEFKYLG